jgi:hypothetical protein
MPSKTPHANGTGAGQNGVNGAKDVEMKEDSHSTKGGKSKKGKDTEDEMTVVVPPSKGSKLSAPPPTDVDNDVEMDDAEKTGDVEEEAEVDPVAKAVSGKNHAAVWSRLGANPAFFMQISKATSRYWRKRWLCSMRGTLLEL